MLEHDAPLFPGNLLSDDAEWSHKAEDFKSGAHFFSVPDLALAILDFKTFEFCFRVISLDLFVNSRNQRTP